MPTDGLKAERDAARRRDEEERRAAILEKVKGKELLGLGDQPVRAIAVVVNAPVGAESIGGVEGGSGAEDTEREFGE